MADKKDIASKMANSMANTHGTIMGVIGSGIKKVYEAKTKPTNKKVSSKEYKTTRCGSCGKFGHHHDSHNTPPNWKMGHEEKKMKYSNRDEYDERQD